MVSPALLRLQDDGRSGSRPGLGFGGDYNPEQWAPEVWAEDARLMQEAGVTFVTVGVFAWARIEPEPGVRDFEWLDLVLDLMHGHGIAVDLATATASPPAWLATAHPEILPVDREGHRVTYGSRQTWCPSSSAYRRHSVALVEDIARRYADHPALVLWHVSNELGCHNALCYCDVSAAAFRGWLRERYGDLEALNSAWGTSFWSQHYGSWEEVRPPGLSTAIPNPTQQLEFRRFSSDELLGQHRAERDVLHRLSPGVPVTTNFMVTSHVDGLDYWKWAPEQDVVSQDHYLDGRLDRPHVELAMCSDWTRGIAGGQPWVLMEHSTSAVNWQPRNHPKRPGEMRRNTLQHVARGADSAGFFQWRASVAGAEKYHSAMLPHAGTDSRVWREVVALGETMRRLGEVAGTSPRPVVALLLDYESWWAVERGSMPLAEMSYLDRALAVYGALWDAGVEVDVRAPGQDLDGYRLVIAPTLHLVRDADAARISAYVDGGGHLLVTYFSGIVDEQDHVRPGGYPGAFREPLGIRVEEFCPLREHDRVQLLGLDRSGGADTWVEDVQLEGADAVLSCVDGPMPGAPAVTRHRFGAGVAWYVATRTDAETTADVLAEVLAGAGVAGSGLAPGVEVVRRVSEDRSYAFVLNHTDAEAEVPFPGFDLLTDTRYDEGFTLAPGDVACIREG